MSASAISWPEPDAHPPRLLANELHLWCASLVRLKPFAPPLFKHLGATEQARVGTYRFDADRLRYAMSRGLSRLLLGNYLDCPPEMVRLTECGNGKPTLCLPTGASIYFNISHSGNVMLFGFTRLTPRIGVDIERCRRFPGMEEFAQRFFSAREAGEILALGKGQRAAAFFNCWTRKEAIVKALGRGLAHGLDKFEVSLLPGQPAALLHLDDELDADRWRLHAFEPVPGYCGALATDAPHTRLVCHQIGPGFMQWP